MILTLSPGDSLRIFYKGTFVSALSSTQESIYIDIKKSFGAEDYITFYNRDVQSNGLVFCLFGDKAIVYNNNKEIAYIDMQTIEENDK